MYSKGPLPPDSYMYICEAFLHIILIYSQIRIEFCSDRFEFDAFDLVELRLDEEEKKNSFVLITVNYQDTQTEGNNCGSIGWTKIPVFNEISGNVSIQNGSVTDSRKYVGSKDSEYSSEHIRGSMINSFAHNVGTILNVITL